MDKNTINYIQNLDTELKAGIKIAESSNYEVQENSMVKVIEYGNGNNKKTEIQYCSNTGSGTTQYNIGKFINKGNGIKINTETGEVIECKQRGVYKTKENIRASMKRAIKIARNNFFGEENELFATLTYYNVETDFDNVVKNMADFEEKMNEKIKNIKYMYFIEQQENRKSWHIHLLLKDIESKKMRITKEEIQKIWGKGNAKMKEIYDIEGLINYLTKSRSKVAEDEEETLKIKKGRKIYNCSKNVDKTISERIMTYGEAEKLIAGQTLINKEAFDVNINIKDETRILRGEKGKYVKKHLNSVKRFLYKEKGGQTK